MKSEILKIEKRDGRVVDWDKSRITEAIDKAMDAAGTEGGETVSSGVLSDKVTADLNRRFSGKIPNVEQIQDTVEKILKREKMEETARIFHDYRQKRTRIRQDKWILKDKDFQTKLSSNALRVLEVRYLKKNDEGKIIETPEELFRRVASNMASAERRFDEDISDEAIEEIEDQFYRMTASLEFLPNSPTLMNAGNVLQQLSACFVLPVPDSLEGIFEAVKEGAIIHQSGGGTGYSFAGLRPKGDVVKTAEGTASGPLSFMSVFDRATAVISQGGKRRGANMGILRIDHPDILDFINAKTDEQRLSNFNISAAVTDEFMHKARRNERYDLINPRSKEVWGRLNAEKVFGLIVKRAWETGDPGVIFIDRINKKNPTPNVGEIEATNPCGELPLLPYESCNLASINVSRMLEEKDDGQWGIDWDKLKDTVHKGVRFLDNVVEVNRYPLKQIEEMTRGNRKIGLGVMGFADMLIKMNIPYDADEALRTAEKLMKFIQEESVKASRELAGKRGAFPNYQGSLYEREGEPPLRNAVTTTIAPTGTISIIAGCSPGIEPLFAVSFTRRNVLGGEEMTEINPHFEERMKKEGIYSKELTDKVKGRASIQDMQEIPENIRKIFVAAHDVKPENHVRIQAAFQKYVDNSVSKTINFPQDATQEEIKKAYFLAWESGCKGITVFRSGAKKSQVIETDREQDKKQPEKTEKVEDLPQFRNPSPEPSDFMEIYCPECD